MMAKKRITLSIEDSQRDHYVRHLGYIRCWISGFEAGSDKRGPHVADTLRQIQLWLGGAA